METQEIIDAIFDVKTNGELFKISNAARDRRKELSSRSRSNWFVGQEVNVVERNRSRGTTTTLGTIKKVNQTRCVVLLPQGSYNVPMSMLEEVQNA